MWRCHCWAYYLQVGVQCKVVLISTSHGKERGDGGESTLSFDQWCDVVRLKLKLGSLALYRVWKR